MATSLPRSVQRFIQASVPIAKVQMVLLFLVLGCCPWMNEPVTWKSHCWFWVHHFLSLFTEGLGVGAGGMDWSRGDWVGTIIRGHRPWQLISLPPLWPPRMVLGISNYTLEYWCLGFCFVFLTNINIFRFFYYAFLSVKLVWTPTPGFAYVIIYTFYVSTFAMI